MRSRLSFVILTILSIVFFVIIFLSISLVKVDPSEIQSKKVSRPSPTVMQITTQEKEKIDNWIYKNKLNPFGDPYDSVYTGGTPLFNETTGEKMDRYEYILGQHPDRPWD